MLGDGNNLSTFVPHMRCLFLSALPLVSVVNAVMLGAKLATLLLVAAVVGTGYSQGCSPPTASDLEGVIASITNVGDAAAPPTITVSGFNVVCQFFTQQEGLLRGVSAVVQYTCTDHSNCPSGTVVEQIESECGFGTDGVTVMWANDVEGSTDTSLIRSQPADATLSTTAREDCSACISPQLAGFVGATTDSITHCVGK